MIGNNIHGGSSFRKIKESIYFISRHNTFLFRRIKVLQGLDLLSDKEIAFLKEKKIKEIVYHASKYSTFYRQLYSSIPLNEPFMETFSKLPILYKADVRKNSKQIATVPLHLLKAAKTSGTSGTPLTIYRSPGSILRENAYTWFYRISHGLNIGDPVISLRGTLDRNTLHYFNKAENVLYLSSYALSRASISTYVKLINEFAPKAIYAYPSAVFNMVNLLNDSGLQVQIPKIFTSSETLYDFQREKIERGFQGKIHDLYGNAERTIALGQCAHGNYHELPLYSMYEFVDNGLITTSLNNKSFPLIRYYVDDLFQREAGRCACGKTYQVKKIDGRPDDVIKCEDGTQVAGAGLSLSFRGIKGLTYAQIVQRDLKNIQVNLVTEANFTQDDQKILIQQLRNRLSDSLKMEINLIPENEIIKTASGKFKLVVSSLNN